MKKYLNIVNFLLITGLNIAFLACEPQVEPEPEKTPTVTSVTVSPSTATVLKGATQQFSATVAGDNNPATTVTWTVTGGATGINPVSSIATNGTLTVAAGETATTLTVRATSTEDTAKSGTAAVTVTTPAPTVSTVTVNPATASVNKGATQQFSAAVTGTNNPLTTVTWSIDETGKNASTTINNSGLLSIAAAETLSSLTVRATSTADITKSGTAIVTVTTPPLPALTGTVSVTGTTQVGQSLTANTTSLGGSGTIGYQWTHGDTASGSFSNISGATSSTYSLVSADEGKYIKVTVTRSENTGSVDSAAVGAVTLPALTGSVTITGTAQVGQTLTANTGSLGGSGGTTGYQWTSSSTSGGTYTNILGATSSTYALVAADVGKYIKVTVTRSGYSGSVTNASASGPVQQQGATDSTSSLTSGVSGAATTGLTEGSRTGITKVDMSVINTNWSIISYNLSSYKGKEITVTFSVDVKREGAAGELKWQINNDPSFPSIASQSNATAGTWYAMSGTWTGTLSSANPSLYLNNDKTSGTTFIYIDNFTVTITETSTGGGGGTPTIPTDPLNPNASGAQTFTSNTSGNVNLSGSPYGYEMWTEGGNNNKLTWYGPNQGGGAAFRAEWNNPNDFLGRIGYYWGNGGPFTQYKNLYADFNYTRSGRSTAGNYSYIGIYGWAKNPSASNADERLIEYYIVEDWFGNQYQDDASPMGTGTTGGSEVGTYTLDGATYKVIKNVRENKPSISGNTTFTQYFSIRQTLRKTGTVSITEHFKKWDALNMKLGNMYECKFLVEAGGGTGWLEFTYLKFSQEDTPR